MPTYAERNHLPMALLLGSYLALAGSNSSTWTAGDSSIFATPSDFRRACGTQLQSASVSASSRVLRVSESDARRAAGLAPDQPFATAFDSRTNWPQCEYNHARRMAGRLPACVLFPS